MGSATNTYYEEEVMSVWEEGQQMLHEEEMETFRRSQEDDEDYSEPEPLETDEDISAGDGDDTWADSL